MNWNVFVCLIISMTMSSAFVEKNPSFGRNRQASSMWKMSATESPTASAVSFLDGLLESLKSPDGGQRLLDASSASWRKAIYEAVGAPAKADEMIVAKSLADKMGAPQNQFAILLGKAENFNAEFPSDPVEYDDGMSWVECRLRGADDDKLLVTMGVKLQEKEGSEGAWLISSLDWQDFRDKFYPGLSGREWLRAF